MSAPQPQPEPSESKVVQRRPAWRWRTLLLAPHRLAFFMAACVMAGSALWWWLEMLSRAGWWGSSARVLPSVFVHPVIMTMGFMPLFFCGFLFTAGPKWLQRPEVSARAIAGPVVAMGLGWGGLLCGTHVHRLVSAAGVGLALLGWLALCWRFIGLIRLSAVRDRLHASVIAGAGLLGALAMAAAALGLATLDFSTVRLAVLLGLWWFIVPVYVTVAHRMIPFFTASALPVLDAWRPNWLLWTLLCLVGLQGVWALLDACGWRAAPLTVLHAWSSAGAGLVVLALAVRWGLVQSLRIRLLAMLHIGFVWLGVAFCLDAVAVWMASTGQHALALMPVHAMTMGFLGSLLLAMATRVSCGHGGRTLAADNLAWGLFWGLQLAVLLRLGALGWAAQGERILVLAASAWLAVMGGWALRYGRWYGRPRLDGRPG